MPNLPPANVPFFPVLTEVVPADARPAIDPEQIVAQVLERLLPQLQHQLRASLLTLVEAQLAQYAPQMRQELEQATRTAVAEALERLPP